MDSSTWAFEGINHKTTCVGDFILHKCNLTVKRPTFQPLARNYPNAIERHYLWIQRWVKNSVMSLLHNYVFVDESEFDINMRSPYSRSLSGTPTIVGKPST
ncbi:hypothetical protein BDF14DRAFT_1891764 [Spinellus fusiger]|nr:hypothetical protein BDF14DRAFT_1891764 [Spinellus fusiger]